MTATFPLPVLRLLLLLSTMTLWTVGSVRAQGVAVLPPTISRMCLWNADKAIWRALGVKRDQVRYLNMLRQRYPAVVEGQWVNEADSTRSNARDGGNMMSVGGPSPTEQGMHTPALGKIHDRSHISEPRIERLGLQAELREVLSDEQLRRWEELCNVRR